MILKRGDKVIVNLPVQYVSHELPLSPAEMHKRTMDQVRAAEELFSPHGVIVDGWVASTMNQGISIIAVIREEGQDES